ncbi:hypothetical protein EJ110_NYTH16968 [Nymphaea thermarum]|nr:hypothetical protein EJ110_NYTH16968 [Nymphaea thermarum]
MIDSEKQRALCSRL